MPRNTVHLCLYTGGLKHPRCQTSTWCFSCHQYLNYTSVQLGRTAVFNIQPKCPSSINLEKCCGWPVMAIEKRSHQHIWQLPKCASQGLASRCLSRVHQMAVYIEVQWKRHYLEVFLPSLTFCWSNMIRAMPILRWNIKVEAFNISISWSGYILLCSIL